MERALTEKVERRRKSMPPVLIGTIGFAVMVLLSLLEVPIFVSLGLVGLWG